MATLYSRVGTVEFLFIGHLRYDCSLSEVANMYWPGYVHTTNILLYRNVT